MAAMTEQHSATPIDPADLPEVISTYLNAQDARDAETAVPLFRPDGVVTDEGNDFHGHDEIRGWITNAASEFTYTTEVTGASRLDETRYDVIHHLEGDFPGGVADLHFRFTLRDGLIQALTIEP